METKLERTAETACKNGKDKREIEFTLEMKVV
jgi:hypothetical protein